MVGAGIVGVATAIHCLRDGHDVILIDKKGPGEGASHGNGGVLAANSVIPVAVPGLWKKAPGMLFSPDQPLFLRWSYLPKLAPYLLRFMRHATADHVRHRATAMAGILGDTYSEHLALATGTGAERWLHDDDYTFLYNDRAHFEGDAFGWGIRKALGHKWEELEGEAFKAHDPAFGPSIGFAVRCPDHGRISDPGAYVKALAKHAESLGAKLIIGAVEDVVRENSQVTGLRIGGETLACDAAVLSAGVWSKDLAEKLGVKVPIESERGYHLELWDPSITPRNPVMVASGKFVATPMEGRLRLAGVVEFGGLDAAPSKAPFKLLEKQIRAAMPGLTWSHTVEWMGHRPAVADSLPLIGEVSDTKGAYFGFGHDHVGLTGGPKTGRLLSQLIAGRQPNIDLTPFSPARFAGARK
ncbi:MAG: FAD-dependent oxidoreductase [Silicimonas sp.]|nr:FAD-dependent oxidoreductase [Silicimonas sp.]